MTIFGITDDWTAQQLREATPWGEAPKYLIRDRDSKYGRRFSAVAASGGIGELRTPFRAPKANAHCERFSGSLKRECLDRVLTLHSYQLHRISGHTWITTIAPGPIRALGSVCQPMFRLCACSTQ